MRNIALLFALLFLSYGANAAPSGWETKFIAGSQVHVYVPQSFSPIGTKANRGLMFVLHGCTQSASKFKIANLEQAAEQYGITIVAPQVTNSVGIGCYPYGSQHEAERTKESNRLISLLDSMLGNAQYSIDPNQVYVTGLSAGGGFAQGLACSYPNKFVAVGLASSPSVGSVQGADYA